MSIFINWATFSYSLISSDTTCFPSEALIILAITSLIEMKSKDYNQKYSYHLLKAQLSESISILEELKAF